MSPFQILGIATDADASTIKKAYASLLRKHRPDEDPEGFQRIHEAYQACLAAAQRAALREPAREVNRQEPTPNDSAASSPALDGMLGNSASTQIDAHAPDEAPDSDSPGNHSRHFSSLAAPPDPGLPRAPAPQQIRFGLSEFIEELCGEERKGPTALQNWLQRCEALYALGLKQAIIVPLLQSLANRRDPISPDGLRVVLGFFGLAAVSQERRYVEGLIHLNESRSRAAWSLHQFVHPAGAASGRMHQAWRRLTTLPHRLVADELRNHRSWFRRPVVLLLPGFKRLMRRLLAGIPRSIDGTKDPILDQEGLAFWRNALDPTRLSKWRILSAIANILACEFAVSLATSGMWPLIGYLALGAPFLLGWMALAFNDAQKLRRALRIDRRTMVDGFLAREFRKPRNPLRRIAILVIPGLMRRMRRVAAEASIVVDPSRDPTFDNDSLRFWRNTMDPARVSMWRVASFGGNIALIVLLIGALSQDASATTGFAVFGLILFVVWTINAAIGAHEFRKAMSKQSKPGNDHGFGLRGTGTISWRWLIWPAIIAANVLSHWLRQN